MNETSGLLLALVVGGLLGAMYFGGLWWTVHRGLSARRPAIWFLGSLLLRTGTTLAGFYWVGQDSWVRLLSCLLGFVAARVIVTWFTRAPGRSSPATEEPRHATQPR